MATSLVLVLLACLAVLGLFLLPLLVALFFEALPYIVAVVIGLMIYNAIT